LEVEVEGGFSLALLFPSPEAAEATTPHLAFWPLFRVISCFIDSLCELTVALDLMALPRGATRAAEEAGVTRERREIMVQVASVNFKISLSSFLFLFFLSSSLAVKSTFFFTCTLFFFLLKSRAPPPPVCARNSCSVTHFWEEKKGQTPKQKEKTHTRTNETIFFFLFFPFFLFPSKKKTTKKAARPFSPPTRSSRPLTHTQTI